VTLGRSGKECTDLETFASLGITAFSDDGSPVESDTALFDALCRLSPFGGVVIEHPEVTSLARGGAVNKGIASAVTGAGGIPESAEFEDVKRCLGVLERAEPGARLHFTHLSSPESVRLAAASVSHGLNVTCDVTPHHLSLDENDLIEMGPVAKMNPPLRSAESRAALVELVRRGKVNAVASDHAPHPDRSKSLSLQDSAFGITGLETLLPVTVDTLVNGAGMPPLDVIRMLTTAPAGILGIPEPVISAGRPLDMVLFDPDSVWRYSKTFSLSSNSPFLGRTLRGRVLRVWVNNEVYREGDFV
jgi:dihydroorotase